jgi:hypothetical protein
MKLIQACHDENMFKLYLYTDSEQALNDLRQTPLYSLWAESLNSFLTKPRKSHRYVTVYSPLLRLESK